MKDLSLRAKAFVLGTLVAGSLLAYAFLVNLVLEPQRIELLAAASVLAAIFQILKIEGRTARSSYNLGWVIYSATFFFLGAPEAYVTILIAHLAEWAWYRYPWYIQSFNIASFAVAIAGADVSQDLLAQLLPAAYGLNEAVAILMSMAVFTFVNHWMVGMAIWLARGQSMAQSGVFDILTLAIDFGLLCFGAAAILIVEVNPSAIILIAIVIYLLYSVLKIPALERKSELDPKTGLYHAQFFDRALEQELLQAQNLNQALSVVMADLDCLRDINDTYGHLAGDAVIKKVAQILQALARNTDIVARFGGEEYAILLPNTTPAESVVLVEAMRKAIEGAEFTFSTGATPTKVTMSFGIAGRINSERSAKELVHDADLALYRAKHTGRNRICIFGQEDKTLAPQPVENGSEIVLEDDILISQHQYIHRTKAMVDQLRSANTELAKQNEEVHNLNEDLLLALASTIDLRDPFVVEHSRHVARYAVLVATSLGLSPERIELVRQAGLMHDIGKLAVPEAILFKPDRLTNEEYEIIKDHVSIGADLLTDFHSLRRISAFVRHHHERFDGLGYPDGLAGEAIPLEARILALADAVEAMASDRPYRAGSPAQTILAEVQKHAGTQFDPDVVCAFERVIEEQGTSIIVNSARNLEGPNHDGGIAPPEAVPAWSHR